MAGGGKIPVGESLVFLLRRALRRFQFRRVRKDELSQSRIGRLKYPHEHQLETESFGERFLEQDEAHQRQKANK